MQALGIYVAKDVREANTSRYARQILASTPILRAALLLGQTHWGTVRYIERSHPWGKLLISAIQDWRRTRIVLTAPARQARELLEQTVPKPVSDETVDRVLVALHTAGLHTVRSLIAEVG
jgi:hypothetical protein